MNNRLLNLAVIMTGFMLALSSIGAVYLLNESRDTQIRRIQAMEAWTRYQSAIDACERVNVLRVRINGLTAADQGERIPLVNCIQAIPKPSVPKPKGTS